MGVYKIIEIVGTSEKSWEEAASLAIEKAGTSLSDLRVAEVKELDIAIDNGKKVYRSKLKVSFKYNS